MEMLKRILINCVKKCKNVYVVSCAENKGIDAFIEKADELVKDKW